MWWGDTCLGCHFCALWNLKDQRVNWHLISNRPSEWCFPSYLTLKSLDKVYYIAFVLFFTWLVLKLIIVNLTRMWGEKDTPLLKGYEARLCFLSLELPPHSPVKKKIAIALCDALTEKLVINTISVSLTHPASVVTMEHTLEVTERAFIQPVMRHLISVKLIN